VPAVWIAGGGWQQRTLRHYAMENLLNFMRVYRELGLPPDKLNEAQRLALRNWNSVSAFGNPLMDDDKARETREAWKKLIDSAHLFGCDIVTGFSGRVVGKSIPDNMDRFAKLTGRQGRSRLADEDRALVLRHVHAKGKPQDSAHEGDDHQQEPDPGKDDTADHWPPPFAGAFWKVCSCLNTSAKGPSVLLRMVVMDGATRCKKNCWA
jgi:hypothetical protein